MEQNFNLIYQISFENDSFLELQKYCTDLITKEPNKIFNSLNFSSISENLLFKIFQSDNLQMSEIQIWEHVLKWGIAQNLDLPSIPANYSQDNFINLRNTLQRFIPLIKFYRLTSKEFLDKVFPYAKIFPEGFYNDLLRAFLSLSDPNSRPSDKSEQSITKENKNAIDSKIITYQHVELISKWIDELEITDKLISSYEFKLLFRASRDGYSRDKFHKFCDNQPRTVTLVKVKSSNEILGGYNPIEWTSDYKYYTTESSFIFSFNDDGIDDYILSHVFEEEKAIFNGCFYGPAFGKDDLYIWPDSTDSYCVKSSYAKSIRKAAGNFDVGECEIFQIV
jgi:hypothetical protein